MQSTVNQGNAQRHDSAEISRHPPARVQIDELISDVQDLLRRVAHLADPDIARLRVKLEEAIATAKAGVARGADRVQRQAKATVETGDQYVRNRPWQAVGVAAAVGLLVGFVVAKRRHTPPEA